MTFQRPSGAHSGADGLANRTKFQNDAAAEPKIAISSTSMDGEFNYILDALNSINAARGTTESIDARIGNILNSDGTLRASLTASLDDWSVHNAENLQRINGTSIRIEGNETGRYTIGRRVRLLENGSALYADVASATFSTFTTVQFINLVSNLGAATTLATHPTQIATAPTITGPTGNATRVQDLLQIGTEFRFIPQNNNLLLQQNTGDTNTPVWSAVTAFDTAGINLNNNSIGLNKLARVGEIGQVLMSNGTGADANFQTLNGVPTGSVQAFAGSTAPTGWVLCDGTALSRTDFAPLFSIIGSTYGAGDMATTFNVPDLRGRTVFGKDDASNRMPLASMLGAAGGSSALNTTTGEHTLTVDELPAHSHALEETLLGQAANGGGTGLFASAGGDIPTSSIGGNAAHSHALDVDITNPFLCLNYMIRT